MKAKEFPDYRDYFLKDWSEELVDNYGYSPGYAIKYAEEEFARDFPDGPDSLINELLCIENGQEGEVVGYLWHSIQKGEPATFIHDFYIHEAHRSKGYGRQSVKALEKSMLSTGITELRLRVAYRNSRALSLYKEIGFMITGINMVKIMSDENL